MPTETRYAQNGEASLAWTTIGEGPIDLLFLPGIISHVEHVRDDPGMAGFLERLCVVRARDPHGPARHRPVRPARRRAARSRTRSTTCSPSWTRPAATRAVLLGYLTGGPLAIKVAAERPERVRALVLYAAVARSLSAPGYDWANDAGERSAAFDRMIERWGTGAMLDEIAPSRAGDVRLRAWLARLERLSSSPGELRRAARSATDFDVRAELAELRVPTLILHRMGDRLDRRAPLARTSPSTSRGARYVELEGVDNLPSVGDSAALLGEIEEFLTGGRRRRGERELLTVLFTDIVGSTGHAARLGDAGWRDLLVAHDAVVRRELDRFGGREVKTIGDAFLVAFAGAPSRAVRCAAGDRRRASSRSG